MIYLIIASLIWGFSFGLVKGSLMDLNTNFVAWARIVLTLPVFLPFLRFRGLNFRLGMHLFVIGMIQYGLLYTCYVKAFHYLDSYQVALFTIFMPIYVTLFDDIYQRKINWINFGMALLAVLGAAVIKFDQGITFINLMFGFILMQISNVCFAWGQIEYRRVRKKHSEIVDKQVYALLFLGACVLTSVVTTFSNGWESFYILKWSHIGSLVFLGVVATGVGFFLWNVGALRTNAGILAVMNNIKIPLAILMSLTLFGEEANLIRLTLGATIMIAAVLLSEYYRVKYKVKTT